MRHRLLQVRHKLFATLKLDKTRLTPEAGVLVKPDPLQMVVEGSQVVRGIAAPMTKPTSVFEAGRAEARRVLTSRRQYSG